MEADEERRSDALLSFQAWEREKKKSMTMHKNRRCQIERGKHRTEEQERKEKMVESEVVRYRIEQLLSLFILT